MQQYSHSKIITETVILQPRILQKTIIPQKEKKHMGSLRGQSVGCLDVLYVKYKTHIKKNKKSVCFTVHTQQDQICGRCH